VKTSGSVAAASESDAMREKNCNHLAAVDLVMMPLVSHYLKQLRDGMNQNVVRKERLKRVDQEALEPIINGPRPRP